MLLYVTAKKQRDISGWIRIEWILLLIFHQLSFSWPFRGFWGGTPLEKCPAQDATSEGAFQRCRLFHLDSSIFRYSWPLGQRSEYLRSQRHGAAHWLPRNKCLSCVKWLAFFHSRDWNTPTSVLTKFNKIRFWGALVRQNSQSHLNVWTTIQWSNGLVESFKDQVAVWNGLGSEGTSLLQSVLVFQNPRGCWPISANCMPCQPCTSTWYTSLKQWSLSRGMIDMNQLLGPSDRNCLSASPSLLCRPARSCKCKQHMETKSKVETSPFYRFLHIIM